MSAFLAPPHMAVAARHEQDAALLAAAGRADALRKPRQALRRARGREPPVLDAAAYAAACGLPIDPDPAAWARVFAARNELVERWLWLVYLTAGRLSAAPGPAPMTLADMVQEGACGLMGAVERYDARRGGAFGMYAYFAIKHAILRAAENQRGPVRLPVHVHNKLSRLRKARALIEMSGRAGAVEEVAAEAGVALEDARLYLDRSRSIRSLDAPTAWCDGATTLYELLADPSDSARQVEIACAKEALARCVRLADLEELERTVVMLKYGLANGVERRRADVSRMLKIEEHKLRRAERNALKKLRLQLSDDTTPWAELLA